MSLSSSPAVKSGGGGGGGSDSITTRPSRDRRRSERPTSTTTTTTTSSPQKIDVLISVYDLLPRNNLSNFLWTIGAGLLHSGVVVGDREYAFGGHDQLGVTGVYWTRPHLEPPGSTFRTAVWRGCTYRTEKETEVIVKEVSDRFLGPSYNLLSLNCNHFTSALCKALLGRSAPGWLNRAAGAGRAFPCFVPRDWIAAPEYETAGGELLDDDDDDGDEMADDVESQLGDDCRGIIRTEWSRRRRMGQSASDLEDNNDHQHGGDAATGHTVIRHEPRVVAETSDDDDEDQAWSVAGGKRIVATGRADDDLPPARVVTLKDNGGRDLPVAERAPMPLGRRG